MADSRITATGTVKLTEQELSYLEQFLNAGDRGGFYLAYYNMTGSAQALQQGQIATFSNAVGGTAYAANGILQDKFGPLGRYAGIYFLSQEVAVSAMDEIRLSVSEATGSGYIDDARFFASAAAAWQRNGQADQFPGNALIWYDLAVQRARQVDPGFANEGAWVGEITAALNEAVSQGQTSEGELVARLQSPGTRAAVAAFFKSNSFAKRLSDFTDEAGQLLPGYAVRSMPGASFTVLVNTTDNKVVGIFGGVWAQLQSGNIADGLAEAISRLVPHLNPGLDVDRVRKALLVTRRNASEWGSPNGDNGGATVTYSLTEPLAPVRASDVGTAQGDTLWGRSGLTNADDVLDGTGGDDALFGGGGTDRLIGGDGRDVLYGQAGADVLLGGADQDVLRGGLDNDVLDGGAGDDVLDGGDARLTRGTGHDTLNGGAGDDLLVGGDGNDALDGGEDNDTLVGGTGTDTLTGGTGFDTYVILQRTGLDVIEDSDGQGEIRLGDLKLVGGKASLIQAYDWIDEANGIWYILRSGSLADGDAVVEITGPGARDFGRVIATNLKRDDLGLDLPENPKIEILVGRQSNPFVVSDHEPTTGVVTSFGEGLAKTFTVALSTASDLARTVKIKLDTLADKFLAVLGDETVHFTGGEITLSVAPGETLTSFALLTDGDIDADASVGLTAELVDSQGGGPIMHTLTLALDAVEEPAEPATNFTITGDVAPSPTSETDGYGNFINGLPAPGRNDILVGGPTNDLIDGLWGDDQADGRGGDDNLFGGEGVDLLFGGIGHDHLQGGPGRDLLEAGPDDDLLEGGEDFDPVLLGGTGDDRVFAGTAADLASVFDTDNVTDATEREWLDGGEGSDTLVAAAGSDVLTGGAGEDFIAGGAGADFLYGDSDILVEHGPTGNVNVISLGEINLAGAADTLVGGGGDDELAGEVGADTLLGGGGADVLFGDANALAFAYHGDDFLDGGAGNDVLHGQGGNDALLGGDGDDLLQGDDATHPQGDDYLDGEDGADTLIGGGGADLLYGGEGADELHGDAEDVPEAEQLADALYGEAGDDVLAGYGGDDYLDGGDGVDTLFGGPGRDTLYGGDGNDTLVGDDGGQSQAGDADLLFGGAGDDILGGQGGADQLEGGEGDDQLSGGEGDDFLGGEAGSDVLLGDAGGDLIDGGAGEDEVSGGDGDDRVFGGADADRLLGDAGGDFLSGDDGDDELQGGAGDDFLEGGEGADVLTGGEGADTLLGGAGTDRLMGGAGDDVYEVSLADGDTIVDDEGENVIWIVDAFIDTLVAEASTANGQSGVLIRTDPAATNGVFIQGGLTLLDAANPTYELAGGRVVGHAALMEEIFTAPAMLTGTSIGDALKGYAGADTLQGLEGNDWLSGGAADDVLEGGEGNDELIGGLGADTLRGCMGDDIYTVDADDTVEELADEGTDTVLADFTYTLGENLESLTLTSDAAIDATGNALDNTLTGNAAVNLLRGLDGVDALFGDDGADTLEGGTGDDALAGGAGDDEYVLSLGDGVDTIDDPLGVNAIRFGTEIEASSLTVSQFVGDDGATYLRIGYGTGSDSIAIRDGLLGHVREYRFADSTVRTHEDILASLGALALEGTAASDTIVGGANADVIDGGQGADQIFGRGADDLLRGGDGADALWGEAGNDVLDGGPGADTLTGGEGEDTYLLIWGMGEDSIFEDAGGLNHLRLGTAVAFEDLVASRVDDDLVLSLRNGSNSVSLAGYYAAAQDWLVTDSEGETRTIEEVIAQSPSGPPDPIEAAIAAYKEKVLREFYSTLNVTVLGGGELERSFSLVTGTESNSTHSTYTLQEVVQASDDGSISRGSASFEDLSETTVTESTMTVYVSQPGSRAVAGGLAAHGAANNVAWRFVPIERFVGRSTRIPAEAVFVRSALPSPDGSNKIVGLWMPEPGAGGASVELPVLPVTVAQTVTITNYFTEQTLTLNLEEIRAGDGDNFIETSDYSVVDAGGGNDFVLVSGLADYILADGPGDRGRVGSLLYGNAGDDSLNGGEGNDVLIGGPGFDSLSGGVGADLYLSAGEGGDSIVDMGEDLERYRAAYYTVANFSDLVLREQHGGQYYDKVDADFYRREDGQVDWGHSDVLVDFFDTQEDGLGNVVAGLEGQLRSLRNDYVKLLRWEGTGSAPTDSFGRTAGELAREIRALEQQIPIEQARYLERFIYVEPLPPLPEIAGNEYAAIEPHYGDVVWVDKVVLDDKWSLSNLMVSTSVVDGEAEALYLSHPDGQSLTITLARAGDPIGTGIELFELADGTTFTIRQVLDLENQDRTLVGTENADTLSGGRGSDTLIGLAGDDSLAGGLGDDVYVFAQVDGVDHVFDEGGADRVRFAGGIAPEDVLITADPFGALMLTLATGDRLTLSNWFDEATRVESVEFADGTIWDVAELESRMTVAPATEFDDFIGGTPADDVIDGLGGNDQINGFGGDDVVEGSTGDDFLEGGAGSDILRGGDGADSLSDGQGNNFFDGGTGDDSLQAYGAPYFVDGGSNFVVGGSGNDFIGSYAVGNVIAFNTGDGQDTVYAANALTLSLGGGIAPSALSLSQDGTDLVLTIGASDSIRLTRQFEADPQAWPQITLQMFGSVHLYDFSAVIADFQAALAADPSLVALPLDSILQAHETSVSETEAFGGALAYQYGTVGNLDALSDVVIRQVLSDPNVGTAPQSIEIQSANQAPTLDHAMADQTAQEDAEFSFMVPADTFADVDVGDTIALSATRADGTALPSWLTFNATTRSFDGTPVNADVGAITVRVTAADSSSASAFDVFELTVVNTNDAPVMSNPVPDQAVEAGSAFNLVLAESTFSDIDQGDVLIYSATLSDGASLPHWLSFEPATRAFSGTPDVGDAGTFSISAKATDLAGASVFDDFLITVDLGMQGVQMIGTPHDDELNGTDLANVLLGEKGDDRLHGRAGDDLLDGGKGDDRLYGNAGNDMLAGGHGDDRLEGGPDNDVYVHEQRGGNDVIEETGGGDMLLLGVGINPGMARLERRRDDLLVALAGEDGSVTVKGWFASDSKKVESIQFADGTAWDADYIRSHLSSVKPPRRKEDDDDHDHDHHHDRDDRYGKSDRKHDDDRDDRKSRHERDSMAELLEAYLAHEPRYDFEALAREFDRSNHRGEVLSAHEIARRWQAVDRYGKGLADERDEDARHGAGGWRGIDALSLLGGGSSGGAFGHAGSTGATHGMANLKTLQGLEEGFHRLRD